MGKFHVLTLHYLLHSTLLFWLSWSDDWRNYRSVRSFPQKKFGNGMSGYKNGHLPLESVSIDILVFLWSSCIFRFVLKIPAVSMSLSNVWQTTVYKCIRREYNVQSQKRLCVFRLLKYEYIFSDECNIWTTTIN